MNKIALITYIVTACIIAVLTIPTATAIAEKKVEDPKTLKVGMIAPDFKLKDQTSTERTLKEFLGKKNVVLAFYPKDFTGG